jgi:hypothetical protein
MQVIIILIGLLAGCMIASRLTEHGLQAVSTNRQNRSGEPDALAHVLP